MRRTRVRAVAMTLAIAAAATSHGQAAFRDLSLPNGGGNQTVNLPQTMTDPMGIQWMVYHQGWFQHQGNNPVYSQSAQLNVNGNQPNTRNSNRCRVDEKTGELLFDFNAQQGIGVSRRVLLEKKAGYVRYVDVFKNTRPQDATINVQLTANLNWGVNSAEILPDPRKRDRNLAWVGTTDGPSCPIEVYAGKGAKVAPSIEWQPGNNTVSATYALAIPAGKAVAIMHVHAVGPTSDAGVKFAESLKETKLIADLPAEVRKQLVNFTTSGGMVGDHEVLRGDLMDVVELRGGDQYKGTLQDPAFKLQTFYGTVELPAERVVGIINVGDFRPRQLLVTGEGEIFGGHLEATAVHLQLSSGQVTQIPLTQVSRIGYRKRQGEPEEWSLAKPMVLLRTGDRMQVDPPQQPIPVSTRYGRLSLTPQSVSAIVLAAEEHGVHDILLADGSKFAGLVDADTFDMTLAGGRQAVKFPASTLARVQLAPPVEPGSEAATLNLTNGDRLVGQLTGEIKLDTSFDTLAINAPEIKKLTHPDPSTLDLQVTLWDDSTFSGQLQNPDVPVRLESGLTLTIPSALIADYVQPSPSPAATTTEKIKSLIAALGADDFAQRERAQSDLMTMGPAVLKVLRDAKAGQSPEAQQRIDTLIKQLEQKPGR